MPLASRIPALFAGVLFLCVLFVPSSLRANEVNREITAGEWKQSGAVGDFPPVQMTRESTSWLFRLNPNSPDHGFGWLEGPPITVSAATDSLPGNTCGLRVHFSFSRNLPAAATPELRIRLNTSSFGQYAMTGVASGRFNQLNSTGKGVAVVELDRTLFSGNTTVIPFIDFLSAQPAGFVNPAFEVRIEKVEFFTKISNSSFARGDLFSTIYQAFDNSIYAHVGGSRSNVRLLQSFTSRSVSYAWDGAFCVVIENRRLYGFTTLNNLQTITIESANVISAAVSDQHVIYLMSNGDLKYYNFVTGERRVIATRTNILEVGAAGDGTLIGVGLRSNNTLFFYQYDTRRSSPVLERLLNDDSAWFFRCRGTGVAPP